MPWKASQLCSSIMHRKYLCNPAGPVKKNKQISNCGHYFMASYGILRSNPFCVILLLYRFAIGEVKREYLSTK